MARKVARKEVFKVEDTSVDTQDTQSPDTHIDNEVINTHPTKLNDSSVTGDLILTKDEVVIEDSIEDEVVIEDSMEDEPFIKGDEKSTPNEILGEFIQRYGIEVVLDYLVKEKHLLRDKPSRPEQCQRTYEQMMGIQAH